MKLGSLFDGSGGFPLAGCLSGITPVWASEIEPYPLRVTAARFPNMKQLGDVTKIDGAEIEPVDIITFGSPCQDLSVAGKQAGIHEGQRSNLFFEAVRIIKEMREATDGKYPRFAVWENVPGAFSSSKGEDFRAVLQALCGICEDGLDIPRPPKGKWNHSGGVAGDGWSIAWRVYDAQYWGVPQRRKRIYLIADFASERAAEILFERESMRWDPAEGGASREGTAADAERSVGRSCCFGIDQQGGKGTAAFTENVSPTLCSDSHGTPHGVCFEPMSLMEENWTEQTVKNALRANASKSGTCVVEPAPFMSSQGATATHTVYALQGNGIDRADTAGCNGCGWREGEMCTLNTIDRPAVCFQQNQRDEVRNMGEQAGALTAQPEVHNQNYLCYPETARALTARHDSSPCVDRGQNVIAYKQTGFAGYEEGVGTLRASGGDNGGETESIVVESVYERKTSTERR